MSHHANETPQRITENTRYSLQKLQEHTEGIRERMRALTAGCATAFDDAIRTFEGYVKTIEGEERILNRNVRLLLAARFFNHVYAALLLSEAGLVADAVSCERSALEALAAFRLVSVAPEYAGVYDTDDFPRPVEVRKLLEELGFPEDVHHIRELYSSASHVQHVSRASERWNSEWSSETEGMLLFGGAPNPLDHREMLRFLAALLHWFAQPLSNP
jgi:hypothetical protein